MSKPRIIFFKAISKAIKRLKCIRIFSNRLPKFKKGIRLPAHFVSGNKLNLEISKQTSIFFKLLTVNALSFLKKFTIVFTLNLRLKRLLFLNLKRCSTIIIFSNLVK